MRTEMAIDSHSDSSDFDLFATDLFPAPQLDSSSSSCTSEPESTFRSPNPNENSSDSASGAPQQVVNPVAHVLLAGALLPGPSPLRLLANHPALLEQIFLHHLCFIWRDTLIPTIVPPFDSQSSDEYISNARFITPSVCKVFTLDSFPPPSGLYCNMMPFIPNDPDTLPSEYRGYAPLIEKCVSIMGFPHAVCYLTIHESVITSTEPQRRGGIHTDGFLAKKYPDHVDWYFWGGHLWARDEPVQKELVSGILHASTVANSCRIWPVQIPRRSSALLQTGCDLEHLRDTLNDIADPVCPGRNELFWMTDATPHESLPLPPGTERQFFRIVTDGISAWWRQHSTPNPLGIEPDCQIIEHGKFEQDAYNFAVRHV